MNDTSDEIRQQMEETKLQLSEKLVSLESQVSNAVQSTGTAVNATVGAVQDVLRFAVNAVDIRRQINRHPWLVLGGSVALGYLAVEFLAGRAKKSEQRPGSAHAPCPSTHNAGHRNGEPAVESAATATAIAAAAYEAAQKSSSWNQLKGLAIGTLIGVVQDVAARAVPRMVDYLTGDPTSVRPTHSENTDERRGSPRRKESPETAQRRHIASSENVRSRNSF